MLLLPTQYLVNEQYLNGLKLPLVYTILFSRMLDVCSYTREREGLDESEERNQTNSRTLLFLALLTMSAQRSWWYYWLSVVVCRPSINFCFKSLLLLQFLFDNSEFFTGETRHIVPPCNKAGISNFCLKFQKLQKFQISWKHYFSYSSYLIILIFLLEKLGI